MADGHEHTDLPMQYTQSVAIAWRGLNELAWDNAGKRAGTAVSAILASFLVFGTGDNYGAFVLPKRTAGGIVGISERARETRSACSGIKFAVNRGELH